ncbi:MAG: oligosaccharide flippase family protein [Acidimicrobiia bacterium]|nr:oligosaccharide flippase family protein [Acidimicrobiia bacterium]
MSEGTLRNAALSGGKWSAVEAVGVQLLSMATTFILARILLDEDFAIVAIVATVTGFLSMASAAGFGASVVQRDELSADDLATTFWTSLGIGLVLTLLGVLFAQPIANLLDHRSAAPFIAVGGIALTFGLPATVPRALLYRSFRQRSVTAVTLIANLVFALFAIGMATLTDIGVWALIIAQVLRPAILLLGAMIAARWLPKLRFSTVTLRADLGFNAGYLGGTVGMYLVKNVDYWFVARALPDGSLGVYYLAYVLPTVIRQRMTWAIDRSLLPVLSRLRDDRDRFAAAYLQVLRLVALVAVPAMVGLSVVAVTVVPIAFGDGWQAVAAPMALLALAAAADALWQAASTLLVADGAPGSAVPVVLIRLGVLVSGLWLVVDTGNLETIALVVLAASTVGAAGGFGLAIRRLPLTVGNIFEAIAPTVVPTAAMAAVAAGVVAVIPAPGAALPVAVIVGVAAYGGSGWLLHRQVFRRLIADLRGVARGGAPASITKV